MINRDWVVQRDNNRGENNTLAQIVGFGNFIWRFSFPNSDYIFQFCNSICSQFFKKDTNSHKMIVLIIDTHTIKSKHDLFIYNSSPPQYTHVFPSKLISLNFFLKRNLFFFFSCFNLANFQTVAVSQTSFLPHFIPIQWIQLSSFRLLFTYHFYLNHPYSPILLPPK